MELEPSKLREGAPKSEAELVLTWIVKCGSYSWRQMWDTATCIHMILVIIIMSTHEVASH